MLKKLKNLCISSKILSIVLITSFFCQMVMAIIMYIGIADLWSYSKKTSEELGEYSSISSESSLKNQSEAYLCKLSKSMSEVSNGILGEVNNQVAELAISVESIYRNSGNFRGSIPALPDMTDEGVMEDRLSASEKAYAVDSNNTSEDGSCVLVYDPGEYPSKFSGNVYRTNIKQWLSFTPDERENIQNVKNVVSSNKIPDTLKNEMKLISNISYFIKPIYYRNKAISTIYIGSESGISYKYSSKSSPVRFDPRVRPWYTDAVSSMNKGSNEPVWQSSYIDQETGNLCITCSMALKGSDGKIIGVIAIDMYLSDINDYIINSKIGENGYSFVINKSGKIIMHPEYNNKNSEFDNYPLDRNDNDDSYREILNNMKSGNTGIGSCKIDDKEYYIAYSPMSITGWSLGIAIEIDEVIKPALESKLIIKEASNKAINVIDARLVNLLVWITFIFIMCCIATVYIGKSLSKQIVKPIEKLEEGVRKIGAGDLSVKLKVESYDETGSLAIAFNHMVRDLQRRILELSKTTAEKERIRSELSIAKKIQLSMLPCIFPAFPDRTDFDIYAITDPAKEVGGDFYDFFLVDDDHLALVIADVSGKGVSAALFMVISKILIKNQAQGGSSPSKILETVNNQLCENNDAGMFVTAFIGILNIKTGEFTFSNAGHNPPIIYRKNTRNSEWLKSDHGFVLAGIQGITYKEYKMNLKRGDIIYMYTDGVTEAFDKENNMFSSERLKSVIDSHINDEITLREFVKSIRKEIDIFTSKAERTDDITMLIFKNLDIEADDDSENDPTLIIKK